MSNQGPLIHDPARSGLWRRFLLPGDGHPVHGAAWRDAIDRGRLVGNCGLCGSYLAPGRPYKVGSREWYPARCISETCGHEVSAAGPAPATKKRGK